MKICFIDKTNFEYDGNSKYNFNLRGAESILINLAEALCKKNMEVTIINNCSKSEIINNINWISINNLSKKNTYDLVISNGDCTLFKYAKSKNNVLFSHSLQSIEKFVRKNQLISYLKYKPKICFLSNYHKMNRSKLLYLFGSIRLNWSVDKIFLESKISKVVDNKLAIFTSRQDRNLKMLMNIWSNQISSVNQKLKLLVTENHYDNFDKSIITRRLGDQRDLIKDLSKSRVCLIPGHKAELFCLSAEEAKELCVPIITLGIGCLKERVEHGKTGFIAKNKEEFANYTLELFNNDNLWMKLRNNLVKQRNLNNWDKVVNSLLNQIN